MKPFITSTDMYKYKFWLFATTLSLAISFIASLIGARAVVEAFITNMPLGPLYNIIPVSLHYSRLILFLLCFLASLRPSFMVVNSSSVKRIIDKLIPDAPRFVSIDRLNQDIHPFCLRKLELDQLKEFAHDGREFSIAIVIGEAGSGKTSLLRELSSGFARSRWDCGFLPSDLGVPATGFRRNTLLLIECNILDKNRLETIDQIMSSKQRGVCKIVVSCESISTEGLAKSKVSNSVFKFGKERHLLLEPVIQKADVITLAKSRSVISLDKIDIDDILIKTNGVIGFIVAFLDTDLYPTAFVNSYVDKFVDKIESNNVDQEVWALIFLSCICAPVMRGDVDRWIERKLGVFFVKKIFPGSTLDRLDIELPAMEPSLVRGHLAIEALCRMNASFAKSILDKAVHEKPIETLRGISFALASINADTHDYRSSISGELREIGRERVELLRTKVKSSLNNSARQALSQLRERLHAAGVIGDHAEYYLSLYEIQSMTACWSMLSELTDEYFAVFRCASAHLYQIECSDEQRRVLLELYNRLIHTYLKFSEASNLIKIPIIGFLSSDAQFSRASQSFPKFHSIVRNFDANSIFLSTLTYIAGGKGHDHCNYTKASIEAKFRLLQYLKEDRSGDFICLFDNALSAWESYKGSKEIKRHILEFVKCAIIRSKEINFDKLVESDVLSKGQLLYMKGVNDLGSDEQDVMEFASSWLEFVLQNASRNAFAKSRINALIEAALAKIPHAKPEYTLHVHDTTWIHILEFYVRMSRGAAAYAKHGGSKTSAVKSSYLITKKFFQRYIDTHLSHRFILRQLLICDALVEISTEIGDVAAFAHINKCVLRLIAMLRGRPEQADTARQAVNASSARNGTFALPRASERKYPRDDR